jgi:arginine decarboxylase
MWTIEDSRALYNIEGWGVGYFDVNQRGHVVVRPDRSQPERELDLYELTTDLAEQGIGLPVLLRFSDILRSRIETLSGRFQKAIQEFDYQGGYTLVYPIKVDQQRHVVEEIVQFGSPYRVGLECGSKPELQAVLALSESTDHMIICNGYKDEEFMRLALMGQKLGHQVFVVIEQVSELDVLLRVADEMEVQPTAGVRIKLASEGFGRWAESGGEKSKFGLTASELVGVIDKLQSAGRLDVLKLIHFHLGSQITDIRYIKAGLQEVARFYAELHAAGVPITHVDVGGGFGDRLRRLGFNGRRQRQLLHPGVRQRRHLHVGRDVSRGRPPDAARGVGIGARPHRASRAPLAQRDRSRVAAGRRHPGADGR